MNLDLSPVESAALARAAAAYNAAKAAEYLPLSPSEYVPVSATEYLRAVVIGSFVKQYARLPGTEFVLRFTGSEIDAIRGAAETDETIAGFLARCRQPEPLNLASASFAAAVQYLVTSGLLAPERVDAVSALPA